MNYVAAGITRDDLFANPAACKAQVRRHEELSASVPLSIHGSGNELTVYLHLVCQSVGSSLTSNYDYGFADVTNLDDGIMLN